MYPKFISPKNALLTLGLIGMTSLISCSKDDDNNTNPTPTPKTINAIVNSDTNFSILKAAIAKVGIGSALESGTLTVFAPDNAAFLASGISLAVVNAASNGFVDSVLKYHVVAAKVLSAGIPNSDTVNTLLGTNLYASKNSNGVFVNGIKVKTADIAASNGVIHVISKVLVPPTKTIAQIVVEDSSLSILKSLVVDYELADDLSGKGKFTVFAPTNQAFSDSAFQALLATGPSDSAVTNILLSHVLGTNVFASDLTEGGNAQTLSGSSLMIKLTPPSLKISGSSQPYSNIILSEKDIIATNGVIHKIDRVLF